MLFIVKIFNAEAPPPWRSYETTFQDKSAALAKTHAIFKYAKDYRVALNLRESEGLIRNKIKGQTTVTEYVPPTSGTTVKAYMDTDSNQASTIACDMTLFIRLLEVAREEIKSDADLHYLVERCSEAQVVKGLPLTMDDYDKLWPAPKKALQALARLKAAMSPESMITLVADSIQKLRKQDVYRLFETYQSAAHKLAAFIIKNRPDLKAEVLDVCEELGVAL